MRVCIVFVAFLLATAAATEPWLYRRPAHESQTLDVTFILHTRNSDIIEQTCQDVSTPSSSLYGQYLTRAEVEEISAPTPETVASVLSWLASAGVHTDSQTHVSPSRSHVRAAISVATAAKLFSVNTTSFGVYTPNPHVKDNTHKRPIVRTSEVPTLPDAVSGVVEVVTGVYGFPPVFSVHNADVGGRRSPTKADRKAAYMSALADPSVSNVTITLEGTYSNITSAYVVFGVTCNNGQPATEPIPCSSTDNAVTSIVLNVTSEYGTDTMVFNATDILEGYIVAVLDLTPFTQYVYTGKATLETGPDTAWSTANGGYPYMTTPFVVPEILADLYDYSSTNGNKADKDALQAVGEFVEQYYSPSDLAIFYEMYNVSDVGKVDLIGYNNASMPGGESTLDLQWIKAVSPMIDTDFWSVTFNNLTGNGPPDTYLGFILEWALEISASDNPPLVNSLSYALTEDAFTGVEFPFYFGTGYINRTESELAKLCARGITVLSASGDAGATDYGHGTNSCLPLSPQYPASSVYVTSVSATFIDGNAPARQGSPWGESAVCPDNGLPWTTGGGFSGVIARPWYQDELIPGYLDNPAVLPPSNLYNASGRGYPDLSAVGHNLMIIQDGGPFPIDGTSASTPITAGLISLINNELLTAGKPQLGLINPLLYSLASSPESYDSIFYDLQSGGNACGDYYCCPYGYQATAGWDAVTGLGSLYFDELLAAAMSASS